MLLTVLSVFAMIERREAFSLASLLVDLHVTQVVNGVKGVHAILPHGALGR